MKNIDHNAEGITLHFTDNEILTLLFLVQEGRLALECDNPTGQTLDDGLREAADKLYQLGREKPVH